MSPVMTTAGKKDKSSSPLMQKLQKSSPSVKSRAFVEQQQLYENASRPSIIDRFKLHSSLMETVKANDRVKTQIGKKEL